MEEYFGHKCVTSDAALEPVEAVSTWAASRRCECVLVQEKARANGASRAVLAAVVAMTAASKKTRRVVLFSLEAPLASSHTVGAGEKLVPLDFSSDWSWLEASLEARDSPLLDKMQERLDKVLQSDLGVSSSAPAASSRPNVVVLDSLNVLLEVGSVIFRVNASALGSLSMVQSLAHEATAVVQVETHSSLLAYPILAKERRREIPKKMHGLVLLLRKKKNGRTSESVEYFHVANSRMEFSPDGENVSGSAGTHAAETTKYTPAKTGAVGVPSKPSAVSAVGSTTGSGKALPVGADEVSFNLSISAEEEVAKRNVQLPYMHQGGGAGEPVNNLLFIDEDDPDWDDDDLDDDLDI